jgi:hypothetical protein
MTSVSPSNMGEGESKTPIPRSSSVGKRLRSLVRKQKSSQEKETGNLKSVIDQYRLRDATSRKDSVSALEFGRAVANAKDAEDELRKRKNICPMYPNSSLRRFLDILLLICVIYDSIFIPLKVAFENFNLIWTSQAQFETFVDVVFILDCLSYFFTAYVSKRGELEVRLNFIASHYLSSAFLFNFICSFPFEAVEKACNRGEGGVGRGIQLVRIFRIARLLRVVGRLSRLSRIAETLIGNIRYTRWGLLMRIVKVFMFVLALLHFLSCWWIFVLKSMEPDNELNWFRNQDLPGDINLYDDFEDMSGEGTVRIYVKSVGVALDMILGESVSSFTVVQRLNVIFIQLLGVSVVATVFGQFGSMMADWNKTESQWHTLMMERCSLMSYMHLPEETQYRIRKFYEYQREQTEHGFVSEKMAEDFISNLSLPLQAEVQYYLHRKELGEISIFADCPSDAIHAVIKKIKFQIYLPGDIIVKQGDAGTTFFLLLRGRCEVLDKTNNVVSPLTAGDHFGEASLINGEKYAATVRAQTYCNFNTLPKDAFDSILEEHPEYDRIIKSSIEASRRQSLTRMRTHKKKPKLFTRDSITHKSALGDPQPLVTPALSIGGAKKVPTPPGEAPKLDAQNKWKRADEMWGNV